MCGIFGIIGKKQSDNNNIKKQVSTLFKLTEVRGKDTSGIAINSNSTISVFKRNIRASKMISLTEYKKFINDQLNLIDELSIFALMGHCRLETNGTNNIATNNQPVVKKDSICIHNGIICNIDELWLKNISNIKREYEIDSEIIIDLLDTYLKAGKDCCSSMKSLLDVIEGETTFAYFSAKHNTMLVATNNGSLYYAMDSNNTFIFSSEKYILEKFLKKHKCENQLKIKQLKSFQGVAINLSNENISIIDFNKPCPCLSFTKHYDIKKQVFLNSKIIGRKSIFDSSMGKSIEYLQNLLEFDEKKLMNIKRCSKCLLPETFPFIEYDNDGVCNYCNNYEKLDYKGPDALAEKIKSLNTDDRRIFMMFSGGRDSSFGLDSLATEYNQNVLAYSYDWGMITDLARRNQSRLCGKLCAEHIIVSANIEKKRANIRKNVIAWLHKPTLGTIPLFMAGDKQYFYYAKKTAKNNGLSDAIVLCTNHLEKTYFKFGFAGVKPNFNKTKQTFSLSLFAQISMISSYIKTFLQNPKFINSSLLDTIGGYISFYIIKHDYINFYDYIPWYEDKVNDVLKKYDWELAPDTETTWRIGDGTAPFYNYIYVTVAGFSENDTLQSNRIREGHITREEGMKIILQDNKPRFESIKWYLDTIKVDYESAIRTINSIPKLYNVD